MKNLYSKNKKQMKRKNTDKPGEQTMIHEVYMSYITMFLPIRKRVKVFGRVLNINVQVQVKKIKVSRNLRKWKHQ